MNCPYSLYIHFPFCLYKCHYCDFNSYAFKERDIPFEPYKQALLAEWRNRLPHLGPAGRQTAPVRLGPAGRLGPSRPIGSIFFGGGTPSLMPPNDVADILDEIRRSASVADDVEVSLEANPKTIDAKKLEDFRRAGINRLSVGIQSLGDAYLGAFGRIHSADDAREALRLVRDAGFKSWNADLMFGFPGQTLEEWEADLDEILGFDPPHLSCYSFTVEEGTIYRRQIQSGKAFPPDSDLQAEMFEMTGKVLEKRGYRRYEISNFARPGHECRHNLNYWNYGEYVGLGAGGVSFLRNGEKSPPPPFVKGGRHSSPPLEKGGQGGFGYRTMNFREPERYMKALTGRGDPAGRPYWFDEESISRKTAVAEFFMMGLRLTDGISKETYGRLFSADAEQHHAPLLREYRQKGWMEESGIRLTPEGRLFSNQIMAAFLP